VHKIEKDNDKFDFSSHGDNSAMLSRLSAGNISMIRGMSPMMESGRTLYMAKTERKSQLIDSKQIDMTLFKMKQEKMFPVPNKERFTLSGEIKDYFMSPPVDAYAHNK